MNREILDQEEPPEAPLPPGLRRRVVRFLLYCLGVMAVIWYRTQHLVESAHASGDLDTVAVESLYRRVLPIGMAAIWMFSGLGTVTVARVMTRQHLDPGWMLLGLAHLALLLVYSYKLVEYFVGWQTFTNGLG
jgi:hypothetical protein